MMTPGMTSQELWIFATDELEIQSNQIFCDLKGYMIYISEYKQTLVIIFQLFFSDLILAVNLER